MTEDEMPGLKMTEDEINAFQAFLTSRTPKGRIQVHQHAITVFRADKKLAKKQEYNLQRYEILIAQAASMPNGGKDLLLTLGDLDRIHDTLSLGLASIEAARSRVASKRLTYDHFTQSRRKQIGQLIAKGKTPTQAFHAVAAGRRQTEKQLIGEGLDPLDAAKEAKWTHGTVPANKALWYGRQKSR